MYMTVREKHRNME